MIDNIGLVLALSYDYRTVLLCVERKIFIERCQLAFCNCSIVRLLLPLPIIQTLIYLGTTIPRCIALGALDKEGAEVDLGGEGWALPRIFTAGIVVVDRCEGYVDPVRLGLKLEPIPRRVVDLLRVVCGLQRAPIAHEDVTVGLLLNL